MISSSYNISEFIGIIAHKSYNDILLTAEKEATEVERQLYRTNTYYDHKMSNKKEYAEALKELICFMRNTVNPFDKNDPHSALFKKLFVN